MTIEEAIQYFERKTAGKNDTLALVAHNPDAFEMLLKHYDADEMALTALRQMAAEQHRTDKPLTMQELVMMDEVPVWITDKHRSGYEFSVDATDYFEGRNPKEYGKTWIAYRHKPKEKTT